MINLTITECETGSINVKWAQVNDVFELSTIANAFDVGVNAVRDELVIDVKEIQQSTDGNEQAIALFGKDAWEALDDAIVLVYC